MPAQAEGARFYFAYRTRVCGDTAAAAAHTRACPPPTYAATTTSAASRAEAARLEQALKALFEAQGTLEKVGFGQFDSAASLARHGGDADRALAELVAHGPEPLERKDPRAAGCAAAGPSAQAESVPRPGVFSVQASFVQPPTQPPPTQPPPQSPVPAGSPLVRDLTAMGFTDAEAQVRNTTNVKSQPLDAPTFGCILCFLLSF